MTIRKVFIKEVKKLKEGEGQYGKWTLYEVNDDKGLTYKTFDDAIELTIGTEIQVEIEEQEREFKGKMYYSKMLKLAVCKGCSLHCPVNDKNPRT